MSFHPNFSLEWAIHLVSLLFYLQIHQPGSYSCQRHNLPLLKPVDTLLMEFFKAVAHSLFLNLHGTTSPGSPHAFPTLFWWLFHSISVGVAITLSSATALSFLKLLTSTIGAGTPNVAGYTNLSNFRLNTKLSHEPLHLSILYNCLLLGSPPSKL